MQPELIGLMVGAVFIAPTIYIIKKNEWDSIAWPMFLVTLPVYYMLFGVLAWDLAVVLKELLYGLPYIVTGLVVWRMKTRLTIVIIAVAWFSHGLYDFYHDVFFVNPGVFSWYPAFCALVDISVAGYLIVVYRQLARASQLAPVVPANDSEPG